MPWHLEEEEKPTHVKPVMRDLPGMLFLQRALTHGSPRKRCNGLRCFAALTPLPPRADPHRDHTTPRGPSAPTEMPKSVLLRQKINVTGDSCPGQCGTAVTALGSLPSPAPLLCPAVLVPWGGTRHGTAGSPPESRIPASSAELPVLPRGWRCLGLRGLAGAAAKTRAAL